MRVAVTGATGFLGSQVVRRLSATGYEVVGLRREQSDTSLLAGVPVEWTMGEVSDETAMERLVEGCNAVVHAAAVLTYWRGAAAEHARVNLGGTRTVAAVCRAAGVGRLVHVSSTAAITATGLGEAADEQTQPGPEHPHFSYHASKLRAEQAVLAEVERGLDAVIVNPSAIHGPYDGGFRGRELVDGVRGRPVVPYFSGGTSIVHVEDAAAGVVAALERGRAGERYILGGENLTWRRFAEIAAEVLGLRRLFVPVPRLVGATAAALGELRSARTGIGPRLSRDSEFASRQLLYFDSSKAGRDLEYRFRPYRAIAQEYVDSTKAAA
jgi:dihydroflavonol-4-reductase